MAVNFPLCVTGGMGLIYKNFKKVLKDMRARLRISISDKNAAAFLVFNESVCGKLAISGRNGILMNAEPACDLARAGQLFAGLQIRAGDAKRDLCDKLITQRNLRIFRYPKFHRDDDMKSQS